MMLIPDLERILFWNGDSLIWIFSWYLPITKRDPHSGMGTPFQNDFNLGIIYLNPRFGTDTTLERVSDWNVPILKWGCLNPRFDMGIPISERGSLQIVYPFETGIPISKRGLTHPRFDMILPENAVSVITSASATASWRDVTSLSK
jgi:hypothetical protein